MWLIWLLTLAIAWRLLRRCLRRQFKGSECILITGCDTGFGRALAERLSEEVVVFAGVLSDQPEHLRLKAGKCGIRVVHLDVNVPEDIEKARQQIVSSGLSLVGFVSNAAVSAYGFCEQLPVERYEENYQVNVLGAIRTTKAVLPILRQNKGRIVFLGSVGGRMPSAFGSSYIPTKAAIGSFAECLRQEMAQFGMHVALVEPGFFATGFLGRARSNGQQESEGVQLYPTFKSQMEKMGKAVELLEAINGGTQGLSSVVDCVKDALTNYMPLARYLIGYDAQVIGRIACYLPCWLIDFFQTYF